MPVSTRARWKPLVLSSVRTVHRVPHSRCTSSAKFDLSDSAVRLALVRHSHGAQTGVVAATSSAAPSRALPCEKHPEHLAARREEVGGRWPSARVLPSPSASQHSGLSAPLTTKANRRAGQRSSSLNGKFRIVTKCREKEAKKVAKAGTTPIGVNIHNPRLQTVVVTTS